MGIQYKPQTMTIQNGTTIESIIYYYIKIQNVFKQLGPMNSIKPVLFECW